MPLSTVGPTSSGIVVLENVTTTVITTLTPSTSLLIATSEPSFPPYDWIFPSLSTGVASEVGPLSTASSGVPIISTNFTSSYNSTGTAHSEGLPLSTAISSGVPVASANFTLSYVSSYATISGNAYSENGTLETFIPSQTPIASASVGTSPIWVNSTTFLVTATPTFVTAASSVLLSTAVSGVAATDGNSTLLPVNSTSPFTIYANITLVTTLVETIIETSVFVTDVPLSTGPVSASASYPLANVTFGGPTATANSEVVSYLISTELASTSASSFTSYATFDAPNSSASSEYLPSVNSTLAGPTASSFTAPTSAFSLILTSSALSRPKTTIIVTSTRILTSEIEKPSSSASTSSRPNTSAPLSPSRSSSVSSPRSSSSSSSSTSTRTSSTLSTSTLSISIRPSSSLSASVRTSSTRSTSILSTSTLASSTTSSLRTPPTPSRTSTSSSSSPSPIITFPPTALIPLRTLCRSPSVTTVDLPLISLFYGSSAYPSLQPFPGCVAANTVQARTAPGLLNCTALGREVQTCQSLGKRVLLSLTGATAEENGNSTVFPRVSAPGRGSIRPVPDRAPATPVHQPNLFTNAEQASQFAATLWSLFGAGSVERSELRPLGPDAQGLAVLHRPLGEEVVVDGFDVQLPEEWQQTDEEALFRVMVARLKQLAGQEVSKDYTVLGPNFV
ncbi:hypothetical protein BU16DRAFT_619893 [Lophium mytilinum]|uniref:Uncharacterized protein n=1 Tax=Lophium mytilinum TaxID=390894 RepID=A0A6A6QMV3_9PEZI|nr:hypothetical protein BU16DRAFT_619893 [Lophium mytilinum]